MGYVHIKRMKRDSLHQFENDIFQQAAGKAGLIIDVRENSGGFTTDHLLTMLTQPVHAYTVPRGGSVGYPQNRKIYATWNKPVVIICNQNTVSNAEIFTHAIKNLGRGKIIGVQTKGNVISTSKVNVTGGSLRIPYRGWHIAKDGYDMELNGTLPDYIVNSEPSQIPSGIDKPLDKAVQILLSEIYENQNKSTIKPIKASDRFHHNN